MAALHAAPHIPKEEGVEEYPDAKADTADVHVQRGEEGLLVLGETTRALDAPLGRAKDDRLLEGEQHEGDDARILIGV